MIVFDVTDPDSFNNLNTWLMEIEKNASKNVYKLLIGNKCDLENRKITYDQAKEIAATYGMKYVETSAKTAHNVADAYITMTKDIIAINAEKDKNVKKGNFFIFIFLDTVKIDDKKNFKDLNKSGCC